MKTNTVLIVAIAAVFAFLMAAIVVVAFAIPEGGNPGSLIALLIGTLAPTIAAIVAVAKVTSVDEKVDDLANGRMDAKIRAAVADVVKDEHLDPAMAQQIEADRVRRDQH